MTDTTAIASEDVLVIGAGPAGIASAYALEQAQITYKVLDRAQQIGSTWANLYPSLRLNTSRFYSHMPTKPFPLSYGLFPTGAQYHAYLTEFVAEHDFNIELGVAVQRVTPSGAYWQVETDHGTQRYKAVISATGIWNHPVLPDIEGMSDFAGEMLHAHDFRTPQMAQGRRVLVVGNGPSGVDIAVACGAVAQTTSIGIRSGVKLSRRYPLGIPKHGWLLLAEHLPKAWCRRLMRWVGSFDFGDTSAYGLRPPPPGSGGMTGYAGDALLKAVKTGKVTPVAAPIRFHATSATLADGRELAVDLVIMATGYQPVLHQYLDIDMTYSPQAWQPQSICDWEIGPNGQRGFPLRDTAEHPNGRAVLGHPGLYLVGVFYKGKGAMYNMTVEAQIAADQIKRYLRQRF